jgi:hypothetical protein
LNWRWVSGINAGVHSHVVRGLKHFLGFVLALRLAAAGCAAENRAAYPALFARAAAEFDVPVDVLQGIAFAETRWSHLTWAPGDTRACNGMPRPYGIMSLWDNEWFGRSLVEAARLIGQPPAVLQADPRQNIRGAAALLRRLHDELPAGERADRRDLAGWRNVIAAYCGIPQPDLAQQHALDVFAHINRGYHRHGIEWDGQPVDLRPIREAVRKVQAEERARRGGAKRGTPGELDAREADAAFGATADFSAQPDYPEAIWRSAYPGHWYTTGYARAFVVIHDMEGYYLSTISYFQRETTQASAHYLVNGKTDYTGDAPPGEITQMVEERYWAWHARCWNQYMFGIEHEGFASDPAWYTEDMYQASGQLTRYLCDKYGIPKDRNHIIAHGQKADANWVNWMRANWPQIDPLCNNHTDPGPYWDWDHYLDIVIGEANNAACAGLSAPAMVAPDATFTATVTMQNNGTKPWTTDATPHNLGSQNPQDNTRWGLGRVPLPASPVNPGATVYFTFTARAPATPGTYAFDWRMVEDGVEWFGQTCAATITVAILPPTITAPPTNQVVNAGQTATFTVAAGGTAPLTYQWRRNGVNLVNGGNVSGATSATLTIANAQLAAAGFYSVIVSNPGGATTSQEAQLVIATMPYAAGSGTGLRAHVYDNADFTSLKRARVDATVNWDWAAGSPSSTTDPDTFSVRWTGQVQPRYSQTYTFHTRTDDGVRLWINGVLLIDKWQDQSATEWSASIALTAGQKYDVRLDYYENGGAAVAQLSWSSASQVKEIIPAAQLYRPPPVIAPVAAQSVRAGNPLSVAVTVSDWDRWLSSQPITDFEDYADGTAEVMFRRPSYSGSTDQFLDTAETNYTTVIASVPAGNSSARVLKARWAFAAGATYPWLRLTTAAAPTLPNPTIDFTQTLWFDAQCDRDLRVALGARETGTTASVGADGGTSGPIEFVGVTGVSGGAPAPTRTISAGAWTTVQLDLPREPVRGFTGNGLLESASGKGVLEHLAFVPASGSGVYRVHLDNVVVVQPNRLAFALEAGAPSGASIDAATGVLTWTPSATLAPGTYAIGVRVTDSASPALSATQTVSVTVLAPPRITMQPQSRSVSAGANVTFTVGAEGTAPLSYQWKRNGAPLLDGGNVSGATNATLLLANVSSADAASYSVTVTNSVGSTNSASATLTVVDPPEIVAPPVDQYVAAGASATFTVTAGGSLPMAYQWFFDGTPLPAATGTNFTRANAQAAHAGFYSVVVSNSAGAVTSAPAWLSVNHPPTLAPIADQMLHAGMVLVLTNAASDPDVPAQTLTFSLDTGAPPGGAMDATSGVLTWPTTETDAGTTNAFTVRVSDGGRPELSNARTFTVAVVSRPWMLGITMDSGTMTITWSALAGRTYRVQFRERLDAGEWRDLTDAEAVGPTASFTEPVGFGRRFYRVAVVR